MEKWSVELSTELVFYRFEKKKNKNAIGKSFLLS